MKSYEFISKKYKTRLIASYLDIYFARETIKRKGFIFMKHYIYDKKTRIQECLNNMLSIDYSSLQLN